LCPGRIVRKSNSGPTLISGHIGVRRLKHECKRRFVILAPQKLKEQCVQVKKYCTTCAQCEPPTWQKKGKISAFPILPKIWHNICMDIFSMPEEYFEHDRYDALIICVDRHSGWIIALTTTKVGLTAEKTSRMLFQKWIDMGGRIPSVITSDQGAQFIGAWFKTMCSQLGIRQAFSQAYRAQANGRAERAGRQIIDWLEKNKC